jgi:hypothetical protein
MRITHETSKRSSRFAIRRSSSRFRDGLIVYLKGYAHREDALRDLGVSEGALEPIDP